MPQYHNLLEPSEYVGLFLKYPPSGFLVDKDDTTLPYFRTQFDILTTFDEGLLKILKKIPLRSLWSRPFSWKTIFAGATITEFLPLPASLPPEDTFSHFFSLISKTRQTLIIIKDLPDNSPLLNSESNEKSQILATEAKKHGFFELSGQALAYVPINFSSTDEYLMGLSRQRRKDLRRKFKVRNSLSIETLQLGDNFFNNQPVIDELYSMYLDVYKQSEVHFDLLPPGFFRAVIQNETNIEGLIVLYRHNHELVAFNILLIHNGVLIDKFIGLRYPLARQLNIYFISWFHNLELALKMNLKTYVAGWTDSEVKASLGAKFSFTRHMVLISNPLLKHTVGPFRKMFESDRITVEKS